MRSSSCSISFSDRLRSSGRSLNIMKSCGVNGSGFALLSRLLFAIRLQRMPFLSSDLDSPNGSTASYVIHSLNCRALSPGLPDNLNLIARDLPNHRPSGTIKYRSGSPHISSSGCVIPRWRQSRKAKRLALSLRSFLFHCRPSRSACGMPRSAS